MDETENLGMICDCHIHSFSKVPEPTRGAYAPPPVDITDYAQEATPFGIRRAVIIQASVDGTDNSRLVGTLGQKTDLALRGVANVDPGNADLQALHSAGVRAIRMQDRARLGKSELDKLQDLARCASSVGWHLELNTEPASLDEISRQLAHLPETVQLVLDHIAHIDPARPDDFFRLRRLMDSGRVWVKLSPTRVSHEIGRYDDLTSIVEQIAQDYPAQCIWGSDWPHVMTQSPLPEIPPMLDLLRRAMSAEQFHACTWLNPERLYGFQRP